VQLKESRKVFEAIRISDPAIDWVRMAMPPMVEKPCTDCPADGLAACATCGGERTIRDLAYEPHDINSFRNLRETAEQKHRRLIFFEGERPVLFRFRRLTRPQIQKFVATATNEVERAIFAFRAGVVEIQRPGEPAFKPEWISRGALVMDEPELRDLEEGGLDWSDEVDIGDQILSTSDVPFGSTPSWRVPQPLVRVWAAAYLRSAERSQSAARATSGAPSGG